MPIMTESLSGYPNNAIHFDEITVAWSLVILKYVEPLAIMVGITNMYGGIFYKVYLLPYVNIPFFILVLWNCGDVVFGCWITSISLSGYAKVCCGWLNEDFLE